LLFFGNAYGLGCFFKGFLFCKTTLTSLVKSVLGISNSVHPRLIVFRITGTGLVGVCLLNRSFASVRCSCRIVGIATFGGY
jgi:hypothetical protein